jgi:HK97 family phage portal protein
MRIDLKGKFQRMALKAIGITDAVRIALGERADQDQGRPRHVYRQVEIVFACVEKLIDGVLGLPLMLSTTDDRIIESGPVYDRIFNNPHCTREELIFQWVGSWALFRDVFIVYGTAVGMEEGDFMIVPGPQMHAVTHDGTAGGRLIAWEFRGLYGERARFAPAEVHQTRNYNPYDKYHGTGPATACYNAIDFCHAVVQHSANSLRNGADPGAILTVPQGVKLLDEEKNYLTANFDARQAGPLKAKRTAILTGGMDIKTIAMKLVDLQASEISDKEARKIAIAFKVPPQLVGLMTEAQYSGGPAMRDFVFNTIIPLAALFSGELTRAFGPKAYPSENRGVDWQRSKFYTGRPVDAPIHKADYRIARQKALQDNSRLFFWFDSDAHPIVQEVKREVAEKVLKFTEAGLTLEKIVEAYDLPFDVSDLPWAKEWIVSAGMIPIRWTLDAGPEAALEPEPGEEPEEETDTGKTIKALAVLLAKGQSAQIPPACEKDYEAKAARIWEKYAASFLPLELEYKSAIRTYFRRQKNEMIKRLEEAWQQQKSADRIKAEDLVMRIMFDLKQENGRLVAIHKTFYQRGQKLGAVQAISEAADLPKDKLTQAARNAVEGRPARHALQVSIRQSKTINANTAERIGKTITEGLGQGEGLSDLTKRISEDFAFSPARAQRIARSSISGSVSGGRFAGLKALGDKLKGWISARSGNVRDSHKTADRQYSTQGIGIDEKFKVGSSDLMYPGDPDGAAEETANCRCMLIPIRTGKGLDAYDGYVFAVYVPGRKGQWQIQCKGHLIRFEEAINEDLNHG